MRFSEIEGQKNFIGQLNKLAEEGRVGHSILFHEEAGAGGVSVAIAFAQFLACPNKSNGDSCGGCPSCNKFQKLIHPDLHFAMPVTSTKTISADKKPISDMFLNKWRELLLLNPYLTEQEWYEGIEVENKSGMIGVNEATAIIKKLSLRSFEGGAKFMIIWLPERMNQEAANKLLKLIEEPPLGTYLFFVSQAPEKVILTILSRCQIFKLSPIGREQIVKKNESEFGTNNEVFRERINLFLGGCANKDLQAVICFWEEIAFEGRERQRSFCRYMLEFLRMAYMKSLHMEQISDTSPHMTADVVKWAGIFKPGFYEKGYNIVNDAIKDIDRNVNGKYIFADMANRFFLSLP
jgi:DNA polymerase III, gamma/tau subunits